MSRSWEKISSDFFPISQKASIKLPAPFTKRHDQFSFHNDCLRVSTQRWFNRVLKGGNFIFCSGKVGGGPQNRAIFSPTSGRSKSTNVLHHYTVVAADKNSHLIKSDTLPRLRYEISESILWNRRLLNSAGPPLNLLYVTQKFKEIMAKYYILMRS